MTFDNRNAIIWTKEFMMNLKEKRQKALRDYIQLIYTLETDLYSMKDAILSAPSLKGNPNDFNQSSFELMFTSIYSVQEQYKRTYSSLKEFLHKAIEFNQTYKLNDHSEIKVIQSKITEIGGNVIKLNEYVKVSPIMLITRDNLMSSINLYDQYMNVVTDNMLSLSQQIDITSYDYRTYFKDKLYQSVKNLKFLMDFTSGSGYSLVSMRNCSIINALDDDKWNEDIINHYPKP